MQSPSLQKSKPVQPHASVGLALISQLCSYPVAFCSSRHLPQWRVFFVYHLAQQRLTLLIFTDASLGTGHVHHVCRLSDTTVCADCTAGLVAAAIPIASNSGPVAPFWNSKYSSSVMSLSCFMKALRFFFFCSRICGKVTGGYSCFGP